jgi:hypothetical protein
VGFVMCGRVYVWFCNMCGFVICVYVCGRGFVICGCVYVWL